MAKNKIKRIKLYTHTDMDGYSCAVILKLYLESQYQIDVEYLDYTDLDCPKLTFKNDIELYDHIFITDLNFKSLDMIERLFGIEIGNKYQDTVNIKIHYIDHHNLDASLMEIFTLAGINFYHSTEDCATKLLRLYLLKLNKQKVLELDEYNNNKNHVINEFVDSVDAYDTWKWKNSYCSKRIITLAEQLSMLFTYWTGTLFDKIMLENLKASTILTAENLSEFKTLMTLKNKYILKKVAEATIYNNVEEGVGCFAYVEAEQYGNDISDAILNILEYSYDKNLPEGCAMSFLPAVDYVVVRNGEFLSFRSKFECANDVAKLFGGGGHLNASGARVPFKYVTKIPKLISDVVLGKKFIKNNEVYYEIKEE